MYEPSRNLSESSTRPDATSNLPVSPSRAVVACSETALVRPARDFSIVFRSRNGQKGLPKESTPHGDSKRRAGSRYRKWHPERAEHPAAVSADQDRQQL